MMGWWHPYFFLDVAGVQILFPWFEIEGPLSFGLATCAIGVLCYADRYLSGKAQVSRSESRSASDDCWHIAWWTGERLTGSLVMLLLMSFNVVIFLETVMFLGLSEYVHLKKKRAIEKGYELVRIGSQNGDDMV
jgi:hypothetical protein